MISWCSQCLGLNIGPKKVAPLHQPLKSVHQNLKLRRSVLSRVHAADDSDCSDEYDDADLYPEEDEYVHRKGKPYLEHPMVVPSTRVVQVQPEGERIHRSNLKVLAAGYNQQMEQTEESVDAVSIYSGEKDSIDYSTPRTSTSSNLLNSNSASLDSSIHTIASARSLQNAQTSDKKFSMTSITSSQYDALLANLAETSSSPDLADSSGQKRPFITLEYSRRRPMKFLSPEEAAKPAPQSPPPRPSFSSSKIQVYPDKPDTQWLGKSLPSLFTGGETLRYAGEYKTEGNTTPLKLRSTNTLRAISVYEGRIDTKNNPVWYSFGSLVLVLRYLSDTKRLEIDIVQVTNLPPGKQKSTVDIQVRLEPGHRHSWVKEIEPGLRHDTETFTAKATIKVRKLANRSFVASAWVDSKRHWPHLALGHAVVPNLEAQDLMSGEWRTFPLQLRQGSEIQDHLGMALVALSCCERTYGYYTFTADVMHVRNVKVQRFGEGAVSSPKARVELWVKAQQLTEGIQQKFEMPPTELMRPAGYDEAQGWEAIYKRGCTVIFNVPKEKVHLATIILNIHGRAKQRLSAKETLFGKIKLGPEELFGGDNSAALGGPLSTVSQLPSVGTDTDGNTEDMKSVPEDPLDPRLTHWGQALRRKAKVEMWHRLQI